MYIVMFITTSDLFTCLNCILTRIFRLGMSNDDDTMIAQMLLGVEFVNLKVN